MILKLTSFLTFSNNTKKNTFLKNYSIKSSDFLLEKQISLEKRKRNQAYATLDYILNMNPTFYRFFSKDAHKIMETAKKISEYYNRDSVTCDIFFMAFFYSDIQFYKSFLMPYENNSIIKNVLKKDPLNLSKEIQIEENKSNIIDFLTNPDSKKLNP